ncbi:winged helix-turn-helix domain-containing protein [Streptomyces sp900105755]|uniref:AfsR/SARP family transcriptional regulator n=1 Tax=Streptomyces sp. 900105755 TaxID=3154389 RepID=UPI00332AA9B0
MRPQGGSTNRPCRFYRVVPTAPKSRQVLAVLALHAGQAVTAGTLTGELWGRQPPHSARATLQTYIMHLRDLCDLRDLVARALRGAAEDTCPHTAKQALRTVPGGYLLDSGEGTSDVREFERIDGTGYRTREAGDERAAARPGLALHSPGRRTDALDAHRRPRTTLVRDQGLEPSAALGRIRQSVLSAPAGALQLPPTAPMHPVRRIRSPGTADPLARTGGWARPDRPMGPPGPADGPARTGRWAARSAGGFLRRPRRAGRCVRRRTPCPPRSASSARTSAPRANR